MTNKKQRGGARFGAGRKFTRRVLVTGGSNTFAFFRAGADTPEFTLTGRIEVDERTGVAAIITTTGDRLVIGDAAPASPEPPAPIEMAADAQADSQLSDLDLQVVRAIWRYGVLTADQVGRLVGGLSRLHWLSNEKYLDRIMLGETAAYTLAEPGLKLIRRDQPAARRLTGPVSAIDPHRPDIAEFTVRLTEAARAWPAGGGLRWYGAHLLALVWPDERQFNPAGLGRLRLGDGSLDFFLEWATADSEAAARIAAYLDLRRRPDAWRGQFSRFPVVLIVVSTPELAGDVIRQLETRLNGADLTVLVTARNRLLAQPGFAPVWRQVGVADNTPRSLSSFSYNPV